MMMLILLIWRMWSLSTIKGRREEVEEEANIGPAGVTLQYLQFMNLIAVCLIHISYLHNIFGPAGVALQYNRHFMNFNFNLASLRFTWSVCVWRVFIQDRKVDRSTFSRLSTLLTVSTVSSVSKLVSRLVSELLSLFLSRLFSRLLSRLFEILLSRLLSRLLIYP